MKKISLFILVIVGLMSFSSVLASGLFTDDFNAYNDGGLGGQGGWTTHSGFQPWQVVSESECLEGKCIKAVNFNARNRKNGDSALMTGQQILYFKLISEEGISTLVVRFYNNSSQFIERAVINLLAQVDTDKYTCGFGTGDEEYEYEMVGEWHSLIFTWDLNVPEISYQIDDEPVRSGTPKSTGGTAGLRTLNLEGYSDVSYVDFIGEELLPPTCDNEHCELCQNWYSCEQVDCCWYHSWWGWPLEDYCADCGSGECGQGEPPFQCTGCLTEEDCELVENCYWSNNVCLFGSGVCGEGSSCSFCESEVDCEAQGCYWYDNFCYINAPEIGAGTLPIFTGWFGKFMAIVNRVPISYILTFASWLDTLQINEEQQASTVSLDFSDILGEGEPNPILDFTQFSALELPYGENQTTFQGLIVMFSRAVSIILLVIFIRFWIMWIFD
jgi:hypothetical protein